MRYLKKKELELFLEKVPEHPKPTPYLEQYTLPAKVAAEFTWYLTTYIERIKEWRIADLGCGTGRWTKFIAKKVKLVEAIDPSDAVFSAAHINKDEQNVRITQASVSNIPFDNNTFDFVICLELIEHLNKKYHMLFLREIQRVAKEKAIIIISTPNLYSIPAFESN